MTAATAASNPIADAEQKAFAPAARVLLGALADGRSATIGELAAAAGRDPDETAAILRSVPDVEWDADDRVAGLGMTLNPTRRTVTVTAGPEGVRDIQPARGCCST